MGNEPGFSEFSKFQLGLYWLMLLTIGLSFWIRSIGENGIFLLIFGFILVGLGVVHYFVQTRAIARVHTKPTFYVAMILFSDLLFFLFFIFQTDSGMDQGPHWLAITSFYNYYFLGEKHYWLNQPVNVDAFGLISIFSLLALMVSWGYLISGGSSGSSEDAKP